MRRALFFSIMMASVLGLASCGDSCGRDSRANNANNTNNASTPKPASTPAPATPSNPGEPPSGTAPGTVASFDAEAGRNSSKGDAITGSRYDTKANAAEGYAVTGSRYHTEAELMIATVRLKPTGPIIPESRHRSHDM
jgi:hypothetical protein